MLWILLYRTDWAANWQMAVNNSHVIIQLWGMLFGHNRLGGGENSF